MKIPENTQNKLLFTLEDTSVTSADLSLWSEEKLHNGYSLLECVIADNDTLRRRLLEHSGYRQEAHQGKEYIYRYSWETYPASRPSPHSVYFCGGCFWGVEKAFQQLTGVLSTQTGYANGHRERPSYAMVCQGNTGHKECVKVDFDPQIISLNTLLKAFFICIRPEQKDGQGEDIGSQYSAAVLSVSAKDKETVENYFAKERKRHKEFHVSSAMLSSFFPAEEYHQHYLEKNPGGYCHIQTKKFEAIRRLNKGEESHEENHQ